MALREYRRKRDFERTPEPAGAKATRAGKHQPIFVVQKHAARRLHYDFRIEIDGVLKSWAVPKGPSLDPDDRRLAVHVEDHPLEYAGFEGVIPPGEYGGGTVMLWDRGWWEELGDPAKDYEKGHLHFVLHGEKLRGEWSLVRIRGRRDGDKGDNWLLIKLRDDEARPGDGALIVERADRSVESGREMTAIAKAKDRVWRSNKGEAEAKSAAKAKPARKPKKTVGARRPALDPGALEGAKRAKSGPTVTPQLATLVEDVPDGDDWLHEIKFDGYRMLATVADGATRLRTRTGLDWTSKFPTLAEAIAALPVDTALLDGEIVHLLPSGVTSFGALQQDIAEGKTEATTYMVFDLLYLDGWDLRAARLEDRKTLLESLLEPGADTQIRYSAHQAGLGPEFGAGVCEHKLEGTISKRRDARYQSGRSKTWLKMKCGNREELVIVGFTDPTGTRKGFGALLLGYFKPDGTLTYSGRVGTGFSTEFLADFAKHLRAIERKKPTVALPAGLSARGTHWVEPKYVAEIRFAKWTSDGVLREPSFVGLREDKKPRDIVLPLPGARPPPSVAAAAAPVARDGSAMVEGFRLTNAERVLYPESGITKLDLAHYYTAVAKQILPHLGKRPLSLLRCPEGIAHTCFFQKHLHAGVPKEIERVTIADKDEKETYLVINELKGLIGLVQMGVLEIHPWGSTVERLETPDRLFFDLDPDEGLSWQRVIDGAVAVRDALAEIGLRSFVKTTGGKGLHVVVPIKPSLAWDEAKAFTRALAQSMAKAAPGLYIATMSKKARAGRIFIDYLRNGRGATAVAAYSTRAKPGATVSTPVSWEEVEGGVRSDQFNIRNLPERLESTPDPWAAFAKTRQAITAAMLRKYSVE
jgi:bifunctional non-homologous end joining protein LigD